MNFKNLTFVFTIIILFAYSCSSSSNDDLNPNPDPDPTPTTNVTYNGDIKAIIDGNCISCHGNSPEHGAPPGSSFTTYTQVNNNVDKIINRIQGTPSIMPPAANSPLSTAQIDLIKKWKTDGLLEN